MSEQMGVPKILDSKEVEKGIDEFQEIKKEKNEMLGKKEIITGKPEEIGKIFGGPFLVAFTSAIAEGINFEDAVKKANIACDEFEKENKEEFGKYADIHWITNANAVVEGDKLIYKSNSGKEYVFEKTVGGRIRFIFPDNSTIAEDLSSLEEE